LARDNKLAGYLVQNLFDSFIRISVRCNRSTYHKIVCAGFKRLARGHRSPLIAGFRPVRTNARDYELDLATEFTTESFDFVRAGYNAIDSCFNA
jgi:hypothetical protein